MKPGLTNQTIEDWDQNDDKKNKHCSPPVEHDHLHPTITQLPPNNDFLFVPILCGSSNPSPRSPHPGLILGNLLQHSQGGSPFGDPFEATDAGVEGHQVGFDLLELEKLEKLEGLLPLDTWLPGLQRKVW